MYVQKILRKNKSELMSLSVKELLNLLYEDLCDIYYRVDVVNSRFYAGYCDSYFAQKVNVNFLGFIVCDEILQKECILSHLPLPILYADCGSVGFFKTKLILTYSKYIKKWSYFTNCCYVAEQSLYNDIQTFTSFEDSNYNNMLFSSFNELLMFLINNYTCPSCYYRSEGMSYVKCLTYGRSKYKDPMSLQFLCYFFIKYFWFHKLDIIECLLPPTFFQKLVKHFMFFCVPRWPDYGQYGQLLN
jgi:hypothetical protein